MTRVSDVTPFCRVVADHGALPFLALARAARSRSPPAVERDEKALGQAALGRRHSGVCSGRAAKEQLEVVREICPPYAIIAGGRPSQARQLEELGICTYLHVPSPGLLDSFLADGARKFIFEGANAAATSGRGGFTLWQSAMNVLIEAELEKPEEVHVVFPAAFTTPCRRRWWRCSPRPLAARA